MTAGDWVLAAVLLFLAGWLYVAFHFIVKFW